MEIVHGAFRKCNPNGKLGLLNKWASVSELILFTVEIVGCRAREVLKDRLNVRFLLRFYERFSSFDRCERVHKLRMCE